MTWNANAKKSWLVMGRWYWYRHTPTSTPFPAWVFDTIGVEYAWLCDPHDRERREVRIVECKGEFLPMEELSK